MLRFGVLAVLLIALSSCVLAETRYGSEVQRLKRSPYECPPYFYPPPHHPRHFPPHPPFWPPPPPPPPLYYQEEQQNQHSQAYSAADAQNAQAAPQNGVGEVGVPEKQPCDKCSKAQSTAVSNAKSVTGDAVAIAIAGKNSS